MCPCSPDPSSERGAMRRTPLLIAWALVPSPDWRTPARCSTRQTPCPRTRCSTSGRRRARDRETSWKDVTIPPTQSPSWPTIRDLFTRQCERCRDPSRDRNSFSCPEASRCGVWSNSTVVGFSSLPLLIARLKRTRSEGVRQKYARSRIAGVVKRTHRVQAETWDRPRTSGSRKGRPIF